MAGAEAFGGNPTAPSQPSSRRGELRLETRCDSSQLRRGESQGRSPRGGRQGESGRKPEPQIAEAAGAKERATGPNWLCAGAAAGAARVLPELLTGFSDAHDGDEAAATHGDEAAEGAAETKQQRRSSRGCSS